ncbi:MAG: kinase/pyrophosphorylase [Rhodospirillaceae bacterium]|nr:kinase/pyrophosphorylase [Rhodospirillaceae bacterium]MBT5193317.1 kinase/pyrophosphorylase [Rhodospirillaceae bacterium]MBT5897625.1 kinase/pyrophosphorylase [Rhodospirillaceae bacterium]MBT6426657.1 kinase/pyrophosphorylase [Rhodospirillaceae bacterium]MBT6987393.1 kinase/pyrophosphorylase [Rhodospirillaceae bacterium]
MTKFHLHLVSDATGDTLLSLASAALAQFEGAESERHIWPMIRSEAVMAPVIAAIEKNPGLVMFTLVDHNLRQILWDECRRLQAPCVPVLDPIIGALENFLGVQSRELPGRQHIMDADYFERIDAIHYSLSHDDGQAVDDFGRADVVLVGISRTSKTPTCMYLANRGLKAANIPMVPGIPLPEEVLNLKDVLVVGLTASPDRLVQIRRNRLQYLNQDGDTDYVDIQAVKEEVINARRLFASKGWPKIDVTRRSIEETAAAIISLHTQRLEDLAGNGAK